MSKLIAILAIVLSLSSCASLRAELSEQTCAEVVSVNQSGFASLGSVRVTIDGGSDIVLKYYNDAEAVIDTAIAGDHLCYRTQINDNASYYGMIKEAEFGFKP